MTKKTSKKIQEKLYLQVWPAMCKKMPKSRNGSENFPMIPIVWNGSKVQNGFDLHNNSKHLEILSMFGIFRTVLAMLPKHLTLNIKRRLETTVETPTICISSISHAQQIIA